MRVRRLLPSLIAAFVVAPLALTPSASAVSGWVTVDPLNAVRSGLVAVTGPDGRIYATAGYQTGSFGQALLDTSSEVYDPATDTWSPVAPIPTARSLPGGALASNGHIYVVGGHTGGGLGYSGVTEAYDPGTDTWTTGLASMPTGRYEVAAAASGGRVYALGGFNNSGGSLATVEAYEPATNTWSAVTPLPTPRRGLAAATGPDGSIYAIGGSPISGSAPSNAVDVYDPDTDTWSSRAPLPTARAYHGAALGADGRIYVAGGLGGGANVEAYDPTTDTWHTVAPLPTPRYAAAAAASGGRVYTVGGQVSTVAQDRVEALVLAGASLSTTALAFGNQEVGTPTAPQSVTVTSDGTLPVEITGVTVTGASAAEFSVTDDTCSGNSFAPGGSCSVSVTFTPSAAGARTATLVVSATSSTGSHTVSLSGTGVITDADPPVLTLPADIVVDAVGPNGAVVTYTVTASDPGSGVASVACSPPSGSVFPIGTTTVSCTATDNRGNTSAPATFLVTVRGGDGQLQDLRDDVQGVGPGQSLARKIEQAQAALAAGNVAGACNALDDFLDLVRAQSGKSLTVAQAQALTADATRIKSVIGC